MRQGTLKRYGSGLKFGFKKGNQHGKKTAGSKHGMWRGGIKYYPSRKTTYRWIRTDVGVYRAEHRVVLEQFLGRKLEKNEAVHHKDGNGLNNSIGNLEVLKWGDHKRKHMGSYKYINFTCQCGKKNHFAKGRCARCYGREYQRILFNCKKPRVNYD